MGGMGSERELKMPLNFAIFGEKEADPIIDSGNHSHYFMSGHSLGGLIAASYINFKNLFILSN